jgi:hypothetical protein
VGDIFGALYLELVDLEEDGIGVHAEGVEQAALVAAGFSADVLHLGCLEQHVRMHNQLGRFDLLAARVELGAQLLHPVDLVQAFGAGAAALVQSKLLPGAVFLAAVGARFMSVSARQSRKLLRHCGYCFLQIVNEFE